MAMVGMKPATTSGTGTTTTHIIHPDHLGGTNVVTDNNGELVQTLDYYPYGSLRMNIRSSNLDEKRKFTGHEYDSEVGLTYMKARYYDGSRGQFLSQDPAFINTNDLERQLADPQRWNSYSYARGNPIVFIDPTGEGPFSAIGGFFVGAATRPVDYARGVWAAGEKYSNTKLGPAGGVLILRDAAVGTAKDTAAAGREAYALATDFRGTTAEYSQTLDQSLAGKSDYEIGKAVGGVTFDAGVAVAGAYGGLKQPFKTASPNLGGFSPKIIKQMEQRGWTQTQIMEAYKSGEQTSAINKTSGNPATRYVNPSSGQSVVIDNKTGEVIHVGGPEFKYGPSSGDINK